MPIIDLVELLDDLWFGSPMWFLPYVDDGQAEAFGGDGFPEPQTVGDAVVVGRLPRGLRASISGTSEAGTSVVQRAPSGLTGWFQNKFGDKRRLSQSEKPEGLVGVSDPCSTLSPPHSRDEDESRDVEPIVGTWGHRQTNYSLAASLPDDAEENGEPQGSEEGGNGSGAGKTERATSAELDRKMSERAWEWRFRQRWAKEHMQDPDATGDQNEEDGLAFMQKHGAHGWQQQFEIRDERSSRRKAPGIESASSQEMFFGPLQTPDATPDMRAGLLQHENSLDVSGEATKKIEHLAQQAKELIMKQQQIDEQVTQRWAACKHGEAWAGQKLPGHAFDMWGEMPYFLVMVQDTAGHQKFLVRAKKAVKTSVQAYASVQQELQRVANRERMSVNDLSVSVLGGGKMSWKQDSSVLLTPAAGSRDWSTTDVTNLVVSLLDREVAVHLDRSQPTMA